MNHLVYLDPQAGELEKILSGVKCMLVKDFDPEHSTAYPLSPGDSLYFLRAKGECGLRVKANVVRLLVINNKLNDDLSPTLKELQPKLQLTEDQSNYWSIKEQVLFVEFNCAPKIAVIHIAPNKVMDRSDWIAFEGFSSITDQ